MVRNTGAQEGYKVGLSEIDKEKANSQAGKSGRTGGPKLKVVYPMTAEREHI